MRVQAWSDSVLLPVKNAPTPASTEEPGGTTGLGLAGAMVYIEHPSADLARYAQRTLGLARPPSELLITTPAPPAFPRSSSPIFELSDEMRDAIGETCMGLLKLASMGLASRPEVPVWLRTGVQIGWFVYGAGKLYGRWQEGADVPTLAIGLGKLAAEGWGLGQTAGFLPTTGFLDVATVKDAGILLSAAGATLEGENAALALLDDKLADADEIYKVARVFEPMIAAGLSSDPAFADYKILPFPYRKSLPLGSELLPWPVSPVVFGDSTDPPADGP